MSHKTLIGRLYLTPRMKKIRAPS